MASVCWHGHLWSLVVNTAFYKLGAQFWKARPRIFPWNPWNPRICGFGYRKVSEFRFTQLKRSRIMVKQIYRFIRHAIWLSFPGSSVVKNTPMQETQGRSLGQEDPLEKGVATHSSIFAWILPWTVEPGGLQSLGSQRIRHDLATDQQQQPFYQKQTDH